MNISFTFPAPARRLSLNDRGHWTRRSNLTREWRHATGIWALQSRPRGGHLPPSTVHVTFEVKDPNRRRDPHNNAPTIKALVDGLVDAGYWPDDTAQWVTVIDPTFIKGTDRVSIHIRPRDPHQHVRSTHAEYVASLTAKDLRGSPDIPVQIGPKAYADHLDNELRRGMTGQ